MAISYHAKQAGTVAVYGLSTDPKPTSSVCVNGATFYEEDTAKTYRMVSGTWNEVINTTYSATITNIGVGGQELFKQKTGSVLEIRKVSAGDGTINITDGGNDTVTFQVSSSVVTLIGTQALSNKTLVTPSVASFAQAQHNHQDGAGGGLFAGSSIFSMTGGQILTSILGTGTASSTTFLRGDSAWATPLGGSDAFPVGAVFIAVVSTNPATLLGYGTWSAIAAGRMLVGLDSGDTDFDLVEEVGGAKTKTIAQTNLPNISTGAGTSHNHTQDAHTHVQDAHSHTQRYHSATTGPLSGPTTAPDASSNTPTNYGIVTATTIATNQNATATNQAEAAHTHSLGGSGTALNVVNPYFVVYIWKRTA